MNASLSRRLRALWALPMLLALAGLLGAAPARAQLAVTFQQQPSTPVVSNQAINPPVVVFVSSGSGIAATGVTVTMTLNSVSGSGALSSTGAVAGDPNGTGSTTTTTGITGGDGSITFTGLTVNLVGTYTLTATADPQGSPTPSAPSSQFTVTPGTPAAVVFTQAIRDVPQGLALNTGTATPGVIVQVQDAAGNAVPGQTITVVLAGQTGTLTGTTTLTSDAAGNAIFRDLKVKPIGRYSLLAKSGSLPLAFSNMFSVIADPVPANVVTNTADDGTPGTLRSVLGIVAPGTTVTFLPSLFDSSNGGSVQTITLLGGEIDVTQDVTVTPPSNGVFVSANNQSRVFGILGGTAAFTGLTIENGLAPNDGAPFFGDGGGLAISAGASLTLTGCRVALSRANQNGGDGNGGGIYNDGSLTLVGCMIGSNTAASDGGGVYNDTDGTLSVTPGVGMSPSNTLFGNNSAGDSGGAISNNGTATLTSALFAFDFGAQSPQANSAVSAGGAINNTGVLSATGCSFGLDFIGPIGNTAADGGAIFNAGGTATLTDCYLLNNSASDGGGVYNAGGTLILTGCAVTSNGASDGGGVYNAGGPVTLTSCTFTANSAGNGKGGAPVAAQVTGGTGSGGGLFTVNGTATLTDDIFYGDTANGGVSEIAGPVTAAFCDIQGNTGTPAVPDANNNFSADPLFSGNGPFGPSVQPAANSPVLGRGTAAAPNFRTTDLLGSPYFSPPTIGAVEGPEDTHVLWTNPDGRTIFWDTNAQGSPIVAGNYSPLVDSSGNGGYAAKSLSTGFNGVSHILWSTPDGHVCLSSVTTAGARTDAFYGPFSDDGTVATTWQPVAVSTDGNGVTHLLWDNPNGRTILWDVNSNGTFTVKGNYGGFSDDGTAATTWKAVSLTSGPDGLNHILFDNADGHTLLWNLDAADTEPANPASTPSDPNASPSPSTAFPYGIFSDDGTANTLWHAQAVSIGEDNVPRLLWTNPDGRTILWNVSTDGTFAITGNFDPLLDPSGNGGFTAVALATGFDNRSHFAWDNANGETYLWNLLNDGGPGGSGANDTVDSHYYGVFSDDGTAATYWKAVAISAAQPVAD